MALVALRLRSHPDELRTLSIAQYNEIVGLINQESQNEGG